MVDRTGEGNWDERAGESAIGPGHNRCRSEHESGLEFATQQRSTVTFTSDAGGNVETPR